VLTRGTPLLIEGARSRSCVNQRTKEDGQLSKTYGTHSPILLFLLNRSRVCVCLVILNDFTEFTGVYFRFSPVVLHAKRVTTSTRVLKTPKNIKNAFDLRTYTCKYLDDDGITLDAAIRRPIFGRRSSFRNYFFPYKRVVALRRHQNLLTNGSRVAGFGHRVVFFTHKCLSRLRYVYEITSRTRAVFAFVSLRTRNSSSSTITTTSSSYIFITRDNGVLENGFYDFNSTGLRFCSRRSTFSPTAYCAIANRD